MEIRVSVEDHVCCHPFQRSVVFILSVSDGSVKKESRHFKGENLTAFS